MAFFETDAEPVEASVDTLWWLVTVEDGAKAAGDWAEIDLKGRHELSRIAVQ